VSSVLDLADPRWTQLDGAYRRPFDPRPSLARLEAGAGEGDAVDAAWLDLWNHLHHQGNVDLASYATVPHLLRIHRARATPDWNTYALMQAIEWERSAAHNPPLPDWLRAGYDQAWHDVVALALADLAHSDDKLLNRCALGVVAMARGLRTAGHLLVGFSEDELEEMVHNYLSN